MSDGGYTFLERFDLLVDADGRPLRNPSLALELPVIPVEPELDWLRSQLFILAEYPASPSRSRMRVMVSSARAPSGT
jgi:hypothetical protein